MSSNALRSQGMIVQVGTGTGSAKTITAISQAFSAQVTASNHGFTVGDRVTFGAVTGMVEINGLTGIVIDAGTNVFVVNIDSRNFTAYTSGGTVTPVTYTEVLEVLDIAPGGAKVSDIDVSDLKSTAMEFFPGLVDNGDFSLNINYLPSDPGQAALRTAFQAGQYMPLKVTAPEGTVYSCLAYVNEFPTFPKAAVNKVQTGTIKFRISGAVTKA